MLLKSKALVIEKELPTVFTPAAPIRSEHSLKGRKEVLSRIIQAHQRKGASIMLFGTRGVGKTSIAQVARTVIGGKSFYYSASATDTFETIATDLLRYNDAGWSASSREKRYTSTKEASIGLPLAGAELSAERESTNTEQALGVTRVTPQLVAARLASATGLIVIDDFERIDNKDEKAKFADLVKKLSDNGVPATLMIVGIAATVGELLAGHESAVRSIVEVHTPPLNNEDIRGVVVSGMERLKVDIEEAAIGRIVDFSAQFPYYTHLLCEGAVRSLIDRFGRGQTKVWTVGKEDVTVAIGYAIKNTEKSIAEAFETGIRSIKESQRFKLALYAIASSPHEPVRFGDICKFVGGVQSVQGKTANVSHQLKRLEDAHIIEKVSTGLYRFRNPILKAFVILKLRADTPGAELAAIDAQLRETKKRLEAVTERMNHEEKAPPSEGGGDTSRT